MQFHHLNTIIRKYDGEKLAHEIWNENGNDKKRECHLNGSEQWHTTIAWNSFCAEKWIDIEKERRFWTTRSERWLWDVDMQRAKSSIKLAMGMTRCQHTKWEWLGTIQDEAHKKVQNFAFKATNSNGLCVANKQTHSEVNGERAEFKMIVHLLENWLCGSLNSDVPRNVCECFQPIKEFTFLFEKLVQHDPCKWKLNWRYIQLWSLELGMEMGKCETSFAKSAHYIWFRPHTSFMPRNIT